MTIKLLCECCGKVHELPRHDEDKEKEALKCNFCIECEDKMTDYYHEWEMPESELPVVVDPNQLKLFNE